MQISDQLIIEQTLFWVSEFIVAHNLCPFARRELMRKSIRFQVFNKTDFSSLMDAMKQELNLLDSTPEIETSLLIYPQQFPEFVTYLDFLYQAEKQLQRWNYDGVYQLASFHPEYCFADADIQDPGNFTNRSPYPMIHILRESSLDRAIERYGNTEEIPQRNIAKMHEMRLPYLERQLKLCLEPNES